MDSKKLKFVFKLTIFALAMNASSINKPLLAMEFEYLNADEPTLAKELENLNGSVQPSTTALGNLKESVQPLAMELGNLNKSVPIQYALRDALKELTNEEQTELLDIIGTGYWLYILNCDPRLPNPKHTYYPNPFYKDLKASVVCDDWDLSDDSDDDDLCDETGDKDICNDSATDGKCVYSAWKSYTDFLRPTNHPNCHNKLHNCYLEYIKTAKYEELEPRATKCLDALFSHKYDTKLFDQFGSKFPDEKFLEDFEKMFKACYSHVTEGNDGVAYLENYVLSSPNQEDSEDDCEATTELNAKTKQ